MHQDHRSLLDLLRKDKPLVEIQVPVSLDLEIAEIHRSVIEEEGPALQFANVIA